MEFLVAAKPIEWESSGDDQFWDEGRYGFSISFDPGEAEESRYHASQGEGAEEFFASLVDAQQWCQQTIDGWVRENVLVTPNG